MQVELLMIGTELLLGQIEDTNSTMMARMLADNGINLYQKSTVGDNRGRIEAALRNALERSGTVLCSGGLGPTEDDLTREAISDLTGVPLEFNESLYNEIVARFEHLRVRITENNKKQATFPHGATPIPNPHGTAPGVLLEHDLGTIICMPGVPHELQAMMTAEVLPYLRDKFGMPHVLRYRVLKVCGLGESRVDALIGDIISANSNPTIGLLANPESVRIRIAARAETDEAATALIAPVEAAIEERLSGLIMGRDDDTLEGVVDALLQEKGWTLGLVENATGGMIAQRLTAARAKAFAGGRVAPDLTADDVAQAEALALDMARDCLVACGSTCGLATIEIVEHRRSVAGLVTPESSTTWETGHYYSGSRNQLRNAVTCLERLRRSLIDQSRD